MCYLSRPTTETGDPPSPLPHRRRTGRTTSGPAPASADGKHETTFMTDTASPRVRPDVRVLLTSGYNEHDAAARFEAQGLAGFIQKPWSVSALTDAVRGVIERRPSDRPAK